MAISADFAVGPKRNTKARNTKDRKRESQFFLLRAFAFRAFVFLLVRVIINPPAWIILKRPSLRPGAHSPTPFETSGSPFVLVSFSILAYRANACPSKEEHESTKHERPKKRKPFFLTSCFRLSCCGVPLGPGDVRARDESDGSGLVREFSGQSSGFVSSPTMGELYASAIGMHSCFCVAAWIV